LLKIPAFVAFIYPLLFFTQQFDFFFSGNRTIKDVNTAAPETMLEQASIQSH